MTSESVINYICESIACGRSDDDIALDLIAPTDQSDDDLIETVLGGDYE